LWCAINSMQKEYASKNLRYVVYTGDIDATPKEILSRARDRFGIAVDETKLDFVYLKTRPWLEAKNYPHFTLALQTLAGLLVGIEALCALNPEVFIDTMGYPLTLPLFRWLAGSQVACYVHYPTISTDMIKRVESREPTYNNADWIAASGLLSVCKIVYYRIFAFFYRLCGMCSQVVMVNGRLKCDDAEKLLNEKKHLQLLSVGQIRPEKDHRLQICTLSELKKTLNSDEAGYSVRLVICGGCRNEEDLERVKNLQKYCKDLQLDENDIEWALNIPIDELCSKMKVVY
uniref:GDP-Man:Man(3)GlcNAc(2)-PP-Dol alpha-1,2-mannosyltransferase n=1 Tax=Anisakis simplex TaxID=6269 RepID=A0A0M3KA31_ANISI